MACAWSAASFSRGTIAGWAGSAAVVFVGSVMAAPPLGWDLIGDSRWRLHSFIRTSYSNRSRSLPPVGDLKDTRTPHIQPVSPPHIRKPDEGGITRRAPHHRAHPVNVRGERADRTGRPTPRTDRLGGGHVEGEDLVQDTPCRIAVQSVFHYAPPVGPK